MTLLSTGFLVDVMRRDPSALDTLRALERGSAAIRIPVIAYADLWEAAGRSRHPPREMERVEALLRGYSSVAVEERHAMRAGILAAKHGLPLREALLALADRSDILLHVCLHGAYHRGQVAVSMRSGGAEPAPTDFIAMRRGVPAAVTTR